MLCCSTALRSIPASFKFDSTLFLLHWAAYNKTRQKWKEHDNWTSLAAIRIAALVRKECGKTCSTGQINDISEHKQCAGGHFRMHTSFNLELEGLKQQRAATSHSCLQRTRKRGSVFDHQNCITKERKNS